jgi:DUF3108-like
MQGLRKTALSSMGSQCQKEVGRMKAFNVISGFFAVFLGCALVVFTIIVPTSARADNCIASFDVSSNTLHVPCFTLGNQSFWLDLGLVSANPVQLQLTNFGTNGATCAQDDVQNGIYRSCNYSPLDVGDTWIYDLNGFRKSVTVSSESHTFSGGTGVRVNYWADPCVPQDIFEAQGQNGIEAFGVYDRDKGTYIDFSSEFSNPLLILMPQVLTIGDSWTDVGSSSSVTFRFIGVEDVIVPAGTFPSCLKIQADIVDSGKGSYTTVFWYAKNVGIVKVLRTIESPQGYQGCIIVTPEYPSMELLSATINGVTYP